MKIILSPSKTQANNIPYLGLNHPRFYPNTKQLIRVIKSYTKDELGELMHIKGKLLDEVFQSYKQYKVNQSALTPAMSLYTGVVYRNFELTLFNERELNYLNDTVRIISALYGVLSPMDGVQSYRLDFTMKVKDISLMAFWRKKIVDYFKDEDLILDCASLEFSQLLSPLREKVHRIEFIDKVDGQEKIISYNAKKLRGLMAHYCVKHQVEHLDQIKNFSEEGYAYQADLSDISQSIFMRSYSSQV